MKIGKIDFRYQIQVVSILLIIAGMWLAIGSNKEDDGVSNYQTNDALITVIDMSNKEESTNFGMISGLLLVLIGVLLTFWIIKNQKEQGEIQKLTNKEEDVVALIERGMSNKEIASELFISISTTKTHINNIFRKFDVSSRSDLLKKLKNTKY